MPELDRDMLDVITGSELIVNQIGERHSLTETAINDLIKNVLKNPLFNTDEVDTDMLQRLSAAIDSGDLEMISMRVEADGAQNPELFKRPIEKVMRELIGDMRLAGKQHYAFQEYEDPHGNRLFAGDANGSVSFQLAQLKIGPHKVPMSIVIYIDGTFLKTEPLYHLCMVSIVPYIFSNIVHDIIYCLIDGA
jgi:hypothetical protein